MEDQTMPDIPDDGPKRVTKRLRYEVLTRDDHTCRYCGGRAPDVELTIDHVVPRALGGRNVPGNLVTACRDCNAGKSSTNPGSERVAEVADDALRWAAAMRQAGEQWRKGEVDARNTFASAWNARDGGGVPEDWGQSIDLMVAAGLTVEDLPILVGRAFTKAYVDDRWSWFCGVAWRVLRERQETASHLLSPPDDTEPDPGLVEVEALGYGIGVAAVELGLSRGAAVEIAPHLSLGLPVQTGPERDEAERALVAGAAEGWHEWNHACPDHWDPFDVGEDCGLDEVRGLPETWQSGFAAIPVEVPA